MHAAQQVLHRLAAAFVRDVQRADAGQVLEHLAREVRHAAVAGGGERELARIRLQGAIISFSEFTGSEGCTVTRCGTEAAIATGAKSLITS